MLSTPNTLWCVALALMLSSAAFAQDQAARWRQRITEAYARTRTYQADITFESSMKDGRWRLMQTFRVAYDRSGNKCLIDRPEDRLVCDGHRIYARSDNVPGRHLEATAPQPLGYDDMLRLAPFMRYPLLPDVAMLLGDDPMAFSSSVRVLDPDPSDRGHRVRLRVDTVDGPVTYLVDGSSGMITGVRWGLGDQVVGPLDPSPQRLSLEIDIVKRNELFEEDLFVFDSANSQPVGQWIDLVSGVGGAGEELVDQPAPPIDLNTLEGDAFMLENVAAEVIVLEFWATWCMPCHRSLQRMQALTEWAQDNNKSVAIVPINMTNMEDSRVDVESFWQWKGFTMRTLLDESGSVAGAYKVGPVPHMVIIHNGVVKRVRVGLSQDVEAALRGEIESLLDSRMVDAPTP
jgi:thiol-disulfide isomerase/thioredoxin